MSGRSIGHMKNSELHTVVCVTTERGEEEEEADRELLENDRTSISLHPEASPPSIHSPFRPGNGPIPAAHLHKQSSCFHQENSDLFKVF